MKRTMIVIVAATAALGLAGCSGSAQSASGAGGGQTAAAGGPNSTPDTPAPGRFPGVSGLVAAVSGRTAQVQGASQQTAVTWTGTTRFTDQLTASASALKVGDCVMARPARAAAGSAQGGTASTTSVAAATVELFPMQGGTCAFGGFAGRNGVRPSGAPTGTASPGAGGAGRRGFGAVGTVSSLGNGQFTVTPVARRGVTAVAPVSVTYSPSTTFTRLAAATAAAVKVGVCVAAQGHTDDTGALTATSVAVSTPTNGSCLSGFGGRGFGGGRGGGPGATSTPGVGNA